MNGELRAFATRFRIAKSFNALSLEKHIGVETKEGYSSLVRLLLTYSAFERFTKSFGLTSDKKLASIEQKHGNDEVIRYIKTREGHSSRLLEFLQDKSSSQKLRNNASCIDRCLDGSVIFLAEAIRHAFAHGDLTPGTWSENPKSLKEVCNKLSDTLILIMDEETEARMPNLRC